MTQPRYARQRLVWILAAGLAATAPAMADDRPGPAANGQAPKPWRARYGVSLPPSSPVIRGGGTPFGTAMIPTPTPPDRGGWPDTPPAAPDTPPPAGVNRPFATIKDFLPAPAPTAGGVLSPQVLPTFLSNLGYEVSTDRGPGDAVVCTVKLRQGTWTVPVQVSFSKDRSHVWLVSALRGNVPDSEGLPARALARLLASNDEIGPVHFSLAGGGRILNLNLAFENRDLSPAAFRGRLEMLAQRAIATEPFWNGPEWGGAPAPR